MSAADWYRRRGSPASIFSTMRASAGGHEEGSGGGGSRRRISASSFELLSASNGGEPASISYSTTPTDQKSTWTSTLPLSSRSGDRYARLPKSFRVSFRLSDSPLAMPKSSTFTLPAELIRTFFGLMSPWMIPRRSVSSTTASKTCAFRRKSHTSAATHAASPGVIAPRAIRSARSSPSTYSISMQKYSSIDQQPCT